MVQTIQAIDLMLWLWVSLSRLYPSNISPQQLAEFLKEIQEVVFCALNLAKKQRHGNHTHMESNLNSEVEWNGWNMLTFNSLFESEFQGDPIAIFELLKSPLTRTSLNLHQKQKCSENVRQIYFNIWIFRVRNPVIRDNRSWHWRRHARC
jgi:hypothetical protein